MIDLLVYLLILVIVFGAVWYIITLLPLPAPFATIAQVVVGVILVVFLLTLLLGVVPLRGPLLR